MQDSSGGSHGRVGRCSGLGHGRGRRQSSSGRSGRGNNKSKDNGNNEKMFEPFSVGKQPTDACDTALKAITVQVQAKCGDAGRSIQSVQEDDCSKTGHYPTEPSAMKVKMCECDNTETLTMKKSDNNVKVELKQVKVECAKDL